MEDNSTEQRFFGADPFHGPAAEKKRKAVRYAGRLKIKPV
jgi:hypothetical protein